MYHNAQESSRPLPEDEDGFAISRADLLHDQLAECGLNDPCWGPAEAWPSWTDVGEWAITDAEDIALLRRLETIPWQGWMARSEAPGE